MKLNRISVFAAFIMLALGSTVAVADEILERNKLLEQMKNKEAKLKLQSEMSKHYQQMQQSGFYVDEDGSPLGITSIQDLATEFRAGRNNNQSGMPFDDQTFTSGFPQMPQAGVPQLNEQTGRVTQRVAKQEDDLANEKVSLLEVRANSVVVRTSQGRVEVRNGQKVGDLTLKRFDLDRAYFQTADGQTKIISIDWAR